jgi:hypothetical protein
LRLLTRPIAPEKFLVIIIDILFRQIRAIFSADYSKKLGVNVTLFGKLKCVSFCGEFKEFGTILNDDLEYFKAIVLVMFKASLLIGLPKI